MTALALALAVACTDDGDSGSSSSTTVADDGGNISETVPTTPVITVDPVALDEVASFGDGVTAAVTDIEAIDAEAYLPGESSGPGVVVTVALTNGTDGPIDLDHVTVDLTDPDGASASRITSREHDELAGDLAAGATASGQYVFTIPVAERDAVEVRVKYAAEAPTVIFEGSVADA